MSTKDRKNILITGSSQGIGHAIAKHFAPFYNVYITGRYSDKLEKLCKENNFKGFIAEDLSKENGAENLFKSINSDIDILINNAGNYVYSPVENLKNEEIISSFMLNSVSALKLIKYFVPYMKKQKWGRIINIGSISGVMGEANASLYSMTKASLIGMTKALALELAQDGITVNIINPGWVDTELINNENLEEDFSREEIIETIPQKRFVTPEEIASACEYLISDNAKSVTGQSINICAGLSLGF